MKKPLGELYSGGPERSLEAELSAKKEKQEPTYVKELRSEVEHANERVKFIHEVLRKLEEDLEIVREKIEAMPLSIQLAVKKGGPEMEKAMADLEMLQNFSKEIEQKMKEKMDIIGGWSNKIKELEEKLVDENWKDGEPSVGDA